MLMDYSSYFIYILASTRTVTPAPLSHPTDRRQTDVCFNGQWGVNSSCWDKLNLTTYLTDWEEKTPICKDDPACCKPDELWSQCFIRLASNGTDSDDCSKSGGCISSDPTFLPVDASIVPEVKYIVHNIYSMNKYFTNWYGALTPSVLSSLLVTQPLITELDPQQKTNFVLGDLLTALIAGLAFIGLPETGAGVSAAAAAARKILLTGLQQAPGVAAAIWPKGTLDLQSIQLGNIDSELSSIMQNFTTAVQSAMTVVMSDIPSFIAFAEHGTFSGSDNTNVPQDAEALWLALRTYVLSTAMTANN